MLDHEWRQKMDFREKSKREAVRGSIIYKRRAGCKSESRVRQNKRGQVREQTHPVMFGSSCKLGI